MKRHEVDHVLILEVDELHGNIYARLQMGNKKEEKLHRHSSEQRMPMDVSGHISVLSLRLNLPRKLFESAFQYSTYIEERVSPSTYLNYS